MNAVTPDTMPDVRPSTIEEVQAFVCRCPKVLPCGGGTKPALSTPHPGDGPPGGGTLNLSHLAGVLEYEPAEFTFTALAGTRLDAVSRLLAEHGQFLPFDPPLAARGATLGGTVASGLSGPGRYQYGGVRDFLLGVRYIDGEGQVIRGGGRVVKNAAGYDLPKLMVGSLGQFGALVELTFKVLPQPEAALTVYRRFTRLEEALEAVYRLAVSPLDPNAVEIEAEREGYRLAVRLAGLENALPARLERLHALIGRPGDAGAVIHGSEEAVLWEQEREMAWVPAGWSLVKIPLTPRRIPDLEAALAGIESLRRYSAGGQFLWLAAPEPVQALHERLTAQKLSGLVVFGPPGLVRLGVRVGEEFERRVKSALDPADRFGTF